jgi:glycogen debranching enzyme
VWPHDTAICAAGAARYGRWDIVDRIMDGALDTAVHFDGRPPELFAGFSRGDIPSPVHYPASCSPQAWASASILHLVTTALGLTASPDGLRSTRTDVSGLPDLTLEGLTGPTGHVDIAVRDGHLSIIPAPRAEHSDHR